MTEPVEGRAPLAAGSFRFLEWPGSSALPPAVLLHGLTALADVWRPTVAALTAPRGHVIAMDQRGHGRSPRPDGRGAYTALRMAYDVVELCDEAGISRPHLVGHSMGGRVAMVLAARFPRLFRSVTIVDIGPEAWLANYQETAAGIETMPESFPEIDAALTFAGRGTPVSGDRAEMFLRRLELGADGRYRWLAPPATLVEIVRTQRLRHYWREWESIEIPALFVRGGATREVRPEVAEAMRRRNPRVGYHEIPAVGHNIPLIAPAELAGVLEGFWAGPGAV